MSILKMGKTTIRTVNDAMLYRYKAAFDVMLEHIHKGIKLNSAECEDDLSSVSDFSLKGHQAYIAAKIDYYDELSQGTKNKGKSF